MSEPFTGDLRPQHLSPQEKIDLMKAKIVGTDFRDPSLLQNVSIFPDKNAAIIVTKSGDVRRTYMSFIKDEQGKDRAVVNSEFGIEFNGSDIRKIKIGKVGDSKHDLTFESAFVKENESSKVQFQIAPPKSADDEEREVMDRVFWLEASFKNLNGNLHVSFLKGKLESLMLTTGADESITSYDNPPEEFTMHWKKILDEAEFIIRDGADSTFDKLGEKGLVGLNTPMGRVEVIVERDTGVVIITRYVNYMSQDKEEYEADRIVIPLQIDPKVTLRKILHDFSLLEYPSDPDLGLDEWRMADLKKVVGVEWRLRRDPGFYRSSTV